MGAWIEMFNISSILPAPGVAPFVGAWIEINILLLPALSFSVAPFVGAWIEIMLILQHCFEYVSRSLRGSVD